MANNVIAVFVFGFLADGISISLVADLNLGIANCGAFGTNASGPGLPISFREVTNVTFVQLDNGPGISSASISKGVMTISFSSAPSAGQHNISGTLIF